MPSYVYDGSPLPALSPVADTSFDPQGFQILGTADANSFNLTGVVAYTSLPVFHLGGGDDSFTGSGQAEQVYGDDGNDSLQGKGGADLLDGGAGDDTLEGGSGDDTLYSSAGNDVLLGGNGTDTLVTQYFTNTFASLSLNAAAAIEVVSLDWWDIYGTAEANSFDLTGITSYSRALPVFHLRAGADSFQGSGQAEQIFGDEDNDLLQGNSGNDLLDGGTGDDTLEGGAGDDTLYSSEGADSYSGGEGNDLLQTNYSTNSFETLTLDAAAGIERVDLGWWDLVGTAGANAFDLTGITSFSRDPLFRLGTGEDSFQGSGQAEQVYGDEDNDLLQGNGGNDTLDGGAGDDTLEGGAGDDTLYSSAGADSYSGGEGNDTLLTNHVTNSFANLTLNAAAGIEMVYLDWWDFYGTADANSFDLTGITSYSRALPVFRMGTGDDSFLGSAQAEQVYGDDDNDLLQSNDGNDTLDGGAGDDTLEGGAGDDTLVYGPGNDSYSGGEGNDTFLTNYGINTFASLTLDAAAAIEYVETGWWDLYGTAEANVFDLSGVTGYSRDPVFRLGTGDDRFTGGSAAEWVMGEADNDLLDGGGGNDTLDGGAGNDTLVASAGTDVYSGGDGADVLRISSAALSGLILDAAASVETVDMNGLAAHGTATANIFDLKLVTAYLGLADFRMDAGDDTFRGSAKAEVVYGEADNDLLQGNDGKDWLEGGAGNDTLNGGKGTDTLLGGAGNDTYNVNTATDQVFETTTTTSGLDAGGTDTVKSEVTFSLAAGAGLAFVENLTLTGSTAINATGNGLANKLVGNSGANVLNGGLGADTLTGGTGADVFVFDSALGGGNIDTIKDFELGVDKIHLDDALFAGLAPGGLDPTIFVSNLTGAAEDGLDRITYETDTGRIYYDADGLGGAARIRFAEVTAGLALSAADFLVI